MLIKNACSASAKLISLLTAWVNGNEFYRRLVKEERILSLAESTKNQFYRGQQRNKNTFQLTNFAGLARALTASCQPALLAISYNAQLTSSGLLPAISEILTTDSKPFWKVKSQTSLSSLPHPASHYQLVATSCPSLSQLLLPAIISSWQRTTSHSQLLAPPYRAQLAILSSWIAISQLLTTFSKPLLACRQPATLGQ